MSKLARGLLVAGVICLGSLASASFAVEPASAEQPAAEGGKSAAEITPASLAADQASVAEKFRDLEKVLIRMAELTAHTDPRRAALLRQAIAQSKDRDLEHRFDNLVDLLKQDRLAVGVKNQGEVQGDLKQLLDLLLSEDRGKRIESEKQRIRDYLRRVNQIIKEQRGLQGETQGGADEKKLAGRQGELGDKTGQLGKDIDKNEGKPNATDDKSSPSNGQPSKGQSKDESPRAGEPKPAGEPKSKDANERAQKDADSKSEKAGKSGDPKAEDGKPSSEKSGKPNDGKPAGEPNPSKPQKDSGNSQPDDSQPGDGKPSKGKPQRGQPQPGQPGESEPGQQSSEPPEASEDNPIRKRLSEAQERMEDARRQLDEAKRKGAAEEQQKAIEALEQAKAELEAILRQLREEERSRMLAMLESRFRKMLDMQTQVFTGTKRLDGVPEPDRDRDHEIECGRMSRKQAEIVGEADRALNVLREEGSAVAFPEAVGEMREDMEQIVVRLSESKVGDITQRIEQDVIAALEEMIASLKKAQKDLADKKPQPGQGGGEPNEPPLVDTIAELKVIRALQMRVNQRTRRYSELIKTEQAEQPELITALKRLAEREERIYKVTRDIVVGRNQ